MLSGGLFCYTPGMRYKHLIQIRTGLSDDQADFYLMRRGCSTVVGRPMDAWEHSHHHWGVTVLPGYTVDHVRRMLEYSWCAGHFRRQAVGTLNLKHICKRNLLGVEAPTEGTVTVQLPPKRILWPQRAYKLHPDGTTSDETEYTAITVQRLESILEAMEQATAKLQEYRDEGA